MRKPTPNQLTIIPVLSTALIVGLAACKEQDAEHSKDNIYSYELTGEYAPSKKIKIGARYTYGSRAAKMSSESGKVTTKVTTAGPKKVVINVVSNSSRTLKCQIVVKRNGERLPTVESTGKNSVTCTFLP